MKTILFTWELGGGQGHVMRFLPVARRLREHGHRVVAALREPGRANGAFDGLGIGVMQAPVREDQPANTIDSPRSFAHILHNVGFGVVEELRARAAEWRRLIDEVAPDLIVLDHSPTALLAAQTAPARRALLGTGFACPIDESPLRDLRPWLPPDGERAATDEQRVLENVNVLLAEWGCPSLTRLSQLYDRVDANCLATFAELDHYAGRDGAEYWGAWPYGGGKMPVWPGEGTKRVYAYVKAFAALPRLLEALVNLGASVIVCVDGVDPKMLEEFRSPQLRFETESLDLRQTAAECDFAVLNGNHGTTAAMLLAGKPVFQVPLHIEQALTGLTTQRLGLGEVASPLHPDTFEPLLQQFITSYRFANAAHRFAMKYADYDSQKQLDRLVARMERLMAASRQT